jgi:hypothetical protein
MAAEGAPTDLRLDLDALPRLIAAYDRAALRLGSIIVDVENRGRIAVPWAQDAVSIGVADHYNEQVFGSAAVPPEYSTLGALRRYRSELVNVRDTLSRIHADYLRAEADAAASFTAP